MRLSLLKNIVNRIDSKKRKLHNRSVRLLKPTKTKIGITCFLLLFLFFLMLVTNPGLTPMGVVVFLVFFPLLLPSHISDALQGDFSLQTNFTPLFFLLLLIYAILLYIVLSILYLLLKNQINLQKHL
jgi:hypothetical protein